MPQGAWEAWVLQVVETIAEKAQMTSLSYYEDVYTKSSAVLRSLRPASIDLDKLNECVNVQLPQGVRSRLESFRPKKGKTTTTPVYGQQTTMSGRMTVVSGPEILHLRKDHRRIITSGFEGGSVVQVDYVSLEPRIALAVAGREVPEDVYEDIRTKIFDGEHARDVIKFFVLAALYGSGADTVSEQTNLDVEVCREFIPKVREYFGRRKIMAELIKECKSRKGKIKNYYGRVLRVPDPKPYKLYNHFVQSTAVDVAMLGFFNIIEHIDPRYLKPLYVIHDSLILDCCIDLKEFIKYGERVPGFEIHLPLESSTLWHA